MIKRIAGGFAVGVIFWGIIFTALYTTYPMY